MWFKSMLPQLIQHFLSKCNGRPFWFFLLRQPQPPWPPWPPQPPLPGRVKSGETPSLALQAFAQVIHGTMIRIDWVSWMATATFRKTQQWIDLLM